MPPLPWCVGLPMPITLSPPPMTALLRSGTAFLDDVSTLSVVLMMASLSVRLFSPGIPK